MHRFFYRVDWTYISPGLLAEGPGKFSVSGTTTTRLILQYFSVGLKYNQDRRNTTYGTFSLAIANAAEQTAAAPPAQGKRQNEM